MKFLEGNKGKKSSGPWVRQTLMCLRHTKSTNHNKKHWETSLHKIKICFSKDMLEAGRKYSHCIRLTKVLGPTWLMYSSKYIYSFFSLIVDPTLQIHLLTKIYLWPQIQCLWRFFCHLWPKKKKKNTKNLSFWMGTFCLGLNKITPCVVFQPSYRNQMSFSWSVACHEFCSFLLFVSDFAF